MPIRAILAAILVAMCWGGNFAAVHISMIDFPPLLTLLLRFIAVSLILAPFALRHPIPRLRDMLVISLTLIVIQFALVFSAMYLGLAITSTIVALQLGVPFACVMAAIFFKDYLGPWRSGGLMVAFLGVLIVAGTPNASEHWMGFLTAILGAFSWSCANIYMKCMKPTPVVLLLFWPALFAVPMLAALSALFEHHQLTLIHEAHAASWVGIAYSTCLRRPQLMEIEQ
jgi:O-acetylserine/cysteine efflux transporter